MIANTTHLQHQKQLRKVAILVATLEEAMAEQLLADLPTKDAVAVREILEQLDEIDPAEYRLIADDFRQEIAQPNPSQHETLKPRGDHIEVSGVELDESLLTRLDAYENSEVSPHDKNQIGTWQSLSEADAATLVEKLSAEQPQTIAVVLSRLEPQRAAELISCLPSSIQTDVLTRLADLDPADDRALQVVESQLAGWITEQRQRKERLAAGYDLVQRILQSTPEQQRTVLLSQLSKRNPTLAGKISTSRSSSVPTNRMPFVPPKAYDPAGSNAPPQSETLQPSQVTETDSLLELEALDDQSLLRALRHTDHKTVMLALAGAGEGLMKRIVRGLPRRQANQFRQQVRSIGPTRLSDMLAAQRELVRNSQL